MDDIHFENTRFDPDLIEFHDIEKQMAKSVGYTAEMAIDQQVAQLLRLRVAQVNERVLVDFADRSGVAPVFAHQPQRFETALLAYSD